MSEIKIQTSRLTLSELQESDFSDFCKLIQDDELMRFDGGAVSDDDAKWFFDKQIENYRELGFGIWICRLNETSETVGICGLRQRTLKREDDVELAFLFHKKYSEQGFEEETMSACIEFAIKTLDVPEVFAVIHTDDTTALNVAERIGMKKVGTGKEQKTDDDTVENHIIFSVKNENWFFIRINYSTDPDNPEYSSEMVFHKDDAKRKKQEEIKCTQ